MDIQNLTQQGWARHNKCLLPGVLVSTVLLSSYDSTTSQSLAEGIVGEQTVVPPLMDLPSVATNQDKIREDKYVSPRTGATVYRMYIPYGGRSTIIDQAVFPDGATCFFGRVNETFQLECFPPQKAPSISIGSEPS